MAEVPLNSSQGSVYEQHQISIPPQHDQENVLASPGLPFGKTVFQKPTALPTVTPKRFTKFFTPRNTASARNGRSKAIRKLKDITRSAVNSRELTITRRDEGEELVVTRKLEDGQVHLTVEIPDDIYSRPAKRRRTLEIPSSPPLSSPIKRAHASQEIEIFEDDEASVAASEEGLDLAGRLDKLRPFPKPIRKIRQGTGSTQRLLQRSFGGYDALTRGHRGCDHGIEYSPSIADFVSTSRDVHICNDRPLPFCTTGCNTNSLVAVGTEEGGVKLLDTSPDASFNTPFLHFRPHKNAITDIAFSSDDYLMATASGDQTSRLVDMHTQQTRSILVGHSGSLKQVRFQPGNDNVITSSGRDGSVQIWDLRCSAKGSAVDFPTPWAHHVDGEGKREIPALFSYQHLKVGFAHRSSLLSAVHERSSDIEAALSITSIAHLPHGRSHILLTASEQDASIKVWDLRQAGRARQPVPLSSTPVPPTHVGRRRFGINSLCLSTDGARLYAVCRDSHIYAYSASHLALGCVPEMDSSTGSAATSGTDRRPATRATKGALGPLYAFKHPSFRNASFYVRGALRAATSTQCEMLAVGSSDGNAVLFPTDERMLPSRNGGQHYEDDTSNDEDELDCGLPTLPSFKRQPQTSNSSIFPVYEQGTALVRGHHKEVSGLAWSHGGDLVSISDDYRVRCWREDAAKARELRGCGEKGEGANQRWMSGWAEVDDCWDEEEG